MYIIIILISSEKSRDPGNSWEFSKKIPGFRDFHFVPGLETLVRPRRTSPPQSNDMNKKRKKMMKRKDKASRAVGPDLGEAWPVALLIGIPPGGVEPPGLDYPGPGHIS